MILTNTNLKTLNDKFSLYKSFLSGFKLFLLCFFLIGTTVAQNKITSNDEIIIKSKAKDLIRNTLLQQFNLLLESDSEQRQQLINNMVLPTDGNMSTFIDDQVVIEDDFSTNTKFSKEVPPLKIETYLNNIRNAYGIQDNGNYENEGKSIMFNNITTSKVMAIDPKSPLFIKVFFDVQYTGIDRRTQLAFKQPCHRVAEIQLKKLKSSWSLAIQTLRFVRDLEEDFAKNVIVEKVVITPDIQKSMIIDETKIVSSNPIIQAFKSNEKWGIKNLNQNEKVLSGPIFDDIYDYSEDGLALVNIEGLWGYIDLEGKIVIKCEYDNAESFSEEKKGRAKVFKGMDVFFIDKNGSKIK